MYTQAPVRRELLFPCVHGSAEDRSDVTFLAAWRENDEGFVVGADTHLIRSKRPVWGDSYDVWAEERDKFCHLSGPHASIAYGFAGADMRGEQFKTFISRQIQEVDRWDDLYHDAKRWLGTLNRTKSANPRDVLTVILAGWIHEDQQMIHLAPGGNPVVCADPDFRATGFGEADIYTGWATSPHSVQDLRTILDRHFARTVMLHGPARLWRLNRDSLTEIVVE